MKIDEIVRALKRQRLDPEILREQIRFRPEAQENVTAFAREKVKLMLELISATDYFRINNLPVYETPSHRFYEDDQRIRADSVQIPGHNIYYDFVIQLDSGVAVIDVKVQNNGYLNGTTIDGHLEPLRRLFGTEEVVPILMMPRDTFNRAQRAPSPSYRAFKEQGIPIQFSRTLNGLIYDMKKATNEIKAIGVE